MITNYTQQNPHHPPQRFAAANLTRIEYGYSYPTARGQLRNFHLCATDAAGNRLVAVLNHREAEELKDELVHAFACLQALRGTMKRYARPEAPPTVQLPRPDLLG